MSCGKSAKRSGAYDHTLTQLKKAEVEVAEFAKVMENPLKDMVICSLFVEISLIFWVWKIWGALRRTGKRTVLQTSCVN